MDLHKRACLTKYHSVEMNLGAKAGRAIAKGEEPELVQAAMVTIGLDVASRENGAHAGRRQGGRGRDGPSAGS